MGVTVVTTNPACNRCGFRAGREGWRWVAPDAVRGEGAGARVGAVFGEAAAARDRGRVV